MWQRWEIAPSLLSQNGLLHPDPAKAGDQPDQAFRAMEDVQMKDEEEELSKDDLFKAAESGRVEVFETLSHRQLSRLCALRNEDDRTLLHVAAAAGHSSVVKLIASNIDISESGANESDEEGWTPLQSAVSSGHADVVTALLQSGADVQKSNKGGRTPLHYAASKGRIEIAHTLILHGAKVNQKDKVGCTPLHRAASAGHPEVCELLLEEGANIDATDRMGETPLMHAAIGGNQQVALLLIRHGADVDAEDKEGYTVLGRISDDMRQVLIDAARVMQEG